MQQLIGKQIGESQGENFQQRYQLEGVLGKRAGRRTFLATDCETGQQVVIKIVLLGPDCTWDMIRLFEREATTLKLLDHPAIPNYLDFFEIKTQSGQGFALVQTYIQAESLQTMVTSGRRFSEPQLKALAQKILEVLAYLHRQSPSIIHRDIKPSNILLGKSATDKADAESPVAGELPEVYLVDFGAVRTAKADGTLTVVGTYGYMPPEQFGGRAHPASDLYSLGATLIYLATGEHPADLMQDNLQIEFEPHVQLSHAFTQWLRHLTYADLLRRLPTAKQAKQVLLLPDFELSSMTTESIESSRTSGETYSPGNEPETSSEHEPAIAPEVYSDFQIYSTPDELDIQCFQYRFKQRFHYLGKHLSQTLTENPLQAQITLAFVAYALGAASLTALLMHYHIPVLRNPMGMVILWFPVALAIAYFYSLQASDPLRKEHMSLQLQRSDDGTLELNYAQLGCETRLVISGILRMVKVTGRHEPLRSQIDFVLLPQKSRGTRKLFISGKLQEIQWLANRLREWGDLPMERPHR